ncbi:hypothetical protein [Clavibacter michiganensis]|uniref:hypothetical protein n=1 Tax=Clavibacter michiganensis TaxID=28447 RepID=UPI0011B0C914|nr:hypothetical protein [Clavibacter michiganensis]
MELDAVLRLLESLCPHADSVRSTSGIRGYYAYVQMHSTTVDGRWVVVQSSGGTIWLETEESYGHFASTEDEDDAEFRETATYFMALASAYVQGNFERTFSRLLKSPTLSFTVDGKTMTMRLEIGEAFRYLFGRHPGSDDHSARYGIPYRTPLGPM